MNPFDLTKTLCDIEATLLFGIAFYLLIKAIIGLSISLKQEADQVILKENINISLKLKELLPAHLYINVLHLPDKKMKFVAAPSKEAFLKYSPDSWEANVFHCPLKQEHLHVVDVFLNQNGEAVSIK